MSGGFYDAGVGPGGEAGTDFRDSLSHDADVGETAAVGVHDAAAAQEDLRRRLSGS